MKLRIQRNSIRFRLTSNELQQFSEEGIIQESIQFSPSKHQTLTYMLEIYEKIPHICTSFDGQEIRIYLPAKLANNWITTDQVSLHHKVELGHQQFLDILIEKDLPCDHKEPKKKQFTPSLHPFTPSGNK